MKRLFTGILAALFLLSILPASVLGTEAVAVWDGTVAEAFAGGSGTQADPYQLADGSQLAYLAQQVNSGNTYQGQYFILTADIRLNDTADLANWATTAPANSWTPIGLCAEWPWITFDGNLDGGDHRISGIYCNTDQEYAGLFSAICYDSTSIQNLTIADSYFSAPGYVGVLAGEIYYSQVRNVTVSNCTVAASGYNAGGLTSAAYDSTIQSVTVTGGRISGQGYLAGICGYADNCTISGCHAAVAIEGVDYDMAGICGCASATQIIGCTSITQIYTACEDAGRYVYEIGGIAGYVDCDSQVINCLNAGDISVQGDICLQIGGVAGYSEGTVRDCCNTGAVSVAGTGKACEIGGVVGCISEGSVENTYNAGTVTASSDGTLEDIGGAVGGQYDGTTLQNTYYPDSCVSGGNTLGTALTGEQITQQDSFPDFDLSWRWEMTSLGPVIASHTVVNGVCTHCGQSCGHSYVNQVCTDCGESCPHTTMNGGFCTACGYRCTHNYVDGVCTVCDMACDHIYQNGVCTRCNMTCDHQWDSELSMCASCKMLCTHETVENDICTLCQAVLAGNVWDGSIADGFDGGTGTREEPYRIATGAQLAWFGQQVSMINDEPAFADQYVVLTADINLRNLPFDPIGYSSSEGYNNWFTGWFDGQGHTVSGVNINAPDSYTVGLFSSIAKRSDGEAGVTNLNVIGSVASDGQYVGGVVGRMEQAIISNCTFRGQVTGGQYTGGILGQGEQGQLLDCKNYASVNGTQWTGGIYGGTEYNAPKVDGCINYGAVRGQQYVAGITARHNKMTEYDDNGDAIGTLNPIVNCGNYGTLTVLGMEEAYYSCGVYGIAYGFSGEVNNCYNVGDLVAVTDEFTMQGITDSMLDCYNSFYACNGNGQFFHGYVTYNAYETVTAEDMKAQSFVDTLNTAANANGWTQWKRGSTYPVFVTETVEVPTPVITGTSLVLDNILRLKVHVQPVGESYTLRVTAGAYVQTLTAYTVQEDRLTFEARLPAHLLHEAVTLELLHAGEVADTKIWTYEDYSDGLQQEHGENEKMMDLVASLNDYGAYTRYFADPTGNAPNAAAVEQVTAAEVASHKARFLTANAKELQAVAALYLDDACDLRLKFNASAWTGNTLYVDGMPVAVSQEGQQVMYVISDLTPQQWDQVFSVQVKNAAGETVYAYEYCVLSYVYSHLCRQQEVQTGLNGMLKAMYLYSRSADAYLEP